MRTPKKNNPKSNLHHLYVLQYLVRLTGDLEIQLKNTRDNLDLQKADAVDIIDFVETRAQYALAVQIEREIVEILSWNL